MSLYSTVILVGSHKLIQYSIPSVSTEICGSSQTQVMWLKTSNLMVKERSMLQTLLVLSLELFSKCLFRKFMSLFIFQNLPSLKITARTLTDNFGTPDSDTDVLGILDHTPNPLPDTTDSKHRNCSSGMSSLTQLVA